MIVVVQDHHWQKALLTSHSGICDLRHGSLYWNFTDLDGSNTRGGYLYPGQSWGVLGDRDKYIDLSEVQIEIPKN